MKKQLFNLSTFQLFNLVSCMGALVVLVPSASFAAAQPVLSLPPFVITGRVTDDRGAGLESAEVRVRKGETLLARGNVGKFEADTSANYALSVPMANTNIATAAVAGDTLTLEIDSAAGTYSDHESLRAFRQLSRGHPLVCRCARDRRVSGRQRQLPAECRLRWRRRVELSRVSGGDGSVRCG